MTLAKELLAQATHKLKNCGNTTAQLDAELLLAYLLNIDRNELFIKFNHFINKSLERKFNKLLLRRINLEPIAYIVGLKEFWSLNFKVNKHTLIPRPDSETLIEFVLEEFPNNQKAYKILDLGCGSGCLGLSLLKEFPLASACFVDISLNALKIAKLNAKHLNFIKRAKFFKSDWFSNLNQQKYDIVVCNPPYIPISTKLMDEVAFYEPHLALFSKNKGIEEYICIAKNLVNYLDINGRAFFEFGINQQNSIAKIFTDHNYSILRFKSDIAGIPRVAGIRISLI